MPSMTIVDKISYARIANTAMWVENICFGLQCNRYTPPPLVHPPTLSTPQQLYQQASIKCGFVSNLKLQKIWHFSISGKKDPKQPPPINGPNLVSSVWGENKWNRKKRWSQMMLIVQMEVWQWKIYCLNEMIASDNIPRIWTSLKLWPMYCYGM